MCTLRVPLLANFWPQYGQIFSFSPVCVYQKREERRSENRVRVRVIRAAPGEADFHPLTSSLMFTLGSPSALPCFRSLSPTPSVCSHRCPLYTSYTTQNPLFGSKPVAYSLLLFIFFLFSLPNNMLSCKLSVLLVPRCCRR